MASDSLLSSYVIGILVRDRCPWRAPPTPLTPLCKGGECLRKHSLPPPSQRGGPGPRRGGSKGGERGRGRTNPPSLSTPKRGGRGRTNPPWLTHKGAWTWPDEPALAERRWRRFGRAGRGGRQRGIGGSRRGLPGSPARGTIGELGAGWLVVGFHELDPKIIEEGFSVAGQPQRDGEIHVGGRLAVEHHAGVRRNGIRGAVLELFAADGVSNDDAAHAGALAAGFFTSTEIRIRFLAWTLMAGERTAATGKSKNCGAVVSSSAAWSIRPSSGSPDSSCCHRAESWPSWP